MRLSAVDCLRRGWGSLMANWELVVLQWLQNILVTVLFLLGFLVPLLMLGLGTDLFTASGPSLEELAVELFNLTPTLLLALLAALAIWTVAFLVHCYFQAGTYGILVTADRQALPGPPRDRRLFRTFSLRDFLGWGGRYVWRFFWFINLFCVLVSLVFLVAVLWLVFIAQGGQRWGEPAAMGIGCGGALPLGFLILVLGLWFGVAQADLAREESGVGAASRVGLSVLGRRLGAVALLFLLVLMASVALAIAFLPLSIGVDLVLPDAPVARAVVHVLLFLLQGLPSALLMLALAAALVALVRSELQGPIRLRSEVTTA
ncbi:MAG: hypothetical protein ACLGI9_11210 [Thermoanaerobaculia bacterium]